MDTQGVTPRATVPPQADRIDLGAVFDEKAGRFGGTPIKKCANGHFCGSKHQEIARILPYPPPVKSLGAKTNHLPNIQGQNVKAALQDGVRNKNFSSKDAGFGSPSSEATIIPSGRPQS
jgi:hypothetical protein